MTASLVASDSVAAQGTCDVVPAVVVAEDGVTLRVQCDQTHDVAFYASDAIFNDVSGAGLMVGRTCESVAATTGTDGNLYVVDPGPKLFVAAVVTNQGTETATVSVDQVQYLTGARTFRYLKRTHIHPDTNPNLRKG